MNKVSKLTSISYRGLIALLGLVLSIGLPLSSAYGLTYNKFSTVPAGSVGDWHDAANWTLGTIPTTNNYVSFKDVGIGVVTQVEPEIYSAFIGQGAASKLTLEPGGGLISDQYFYVGYGANGNGVMIQNGGSLNVGTSLRCGVETGGFGTYTQFAGTITCDGFALGYSASSEGVFNMVDGILSVTGAGATYIGFSGTGTLNQAAGDLNLFSALTLGYAAGSVGTWNLSGGSLDIGGQLILGYNGSATINQSGGTNTLKLVDYLYISLYGDGTYNLTGGALRIERDQPKAIYIGHTGSGTLNIGDANGTGIIEGFGADPDPISVVVRGSAGVSGVIHGWGGINISGSITMNGLVIADGYGTDRTLWMTNSSSIRNDIDNAVDGTNGWYAVNHGKLALPTLAVSAPGVYYWGEYLDLDLVNSVKVQGASGAGTVMGTLLAADRDDVNANMQAVGVWEFSNPGGGLNLVNLTFRYDHVNAAKLGIPEADLKVYRHNGTKWMDVTSSIDTANNTITADGVSSVGQFAVGKYLPAGTIILIQ